METWVLNNAWIKDVKFGNLDYGSEDMQKQGLFCVKKWEYQFAKGTSGSPVKNVNSSKNQQEGWKSFTVIEGESNFFKKPGCWKILTASKDCLIVKSKADSSKTSKSLRQISWTLGLLFGRFF